MEARDQRQEGFGRLVVAHVLPRVGTRERVQRVPGAEGAEGAVAAKVQRVRRCSRCGGAEGADLQHVLLGTDELIGLGQQRRAARLHQQPTGLAHQRVGARAREGVGAA